MIRFISGTGTIGKRDKEFIVCFFINGVSPEVSAETNQAIFVTLRELLADGLFSSPPNDYPPSY